MRPVVTLLFLALVGLAAGCGTAKFIRAEGAPTYKALPRGTDVDVAASAEDLPQPAQVLGELRAATRAGDNADVGGAIGLLRLHAPHYGCDAIVGLSVTAEDVPVQKTTAGKTVKTASKVYHWTAQCVRTAAAEGGALPRAVASADTKKKAAASLAPEKTPETTASATEPTVTAAPESSADGTAGKTETSFVSDTSVTPRVKEIWERMQPYRSSYLRPWAEFLVRPPRSAMESVEALNELMIKVAGPTGFWRKNVPTWFGCEVDPKTQNCVRILKVSNHVANWDNLLEQMQRVDKAGASRFVGRNIEHIRDFLDNVVPASPRLSAMKETTLYKRYLKGLMD